ncbi:MAG: AAA family ATPase [Bacteroidales bacterium]|nr:AAA family ATPase [Bacteroidales bacterium]
MRLYQRENEIAELKRICNLSFTHNSRMTVLTGRRRIGKTSLIKKTFEDSDAPMLYFFTGRKAEAALVDDFVREIHNKLHGYVPEGLMSVTGVLRHLFELAKTERFTLVIDEFQEFMTVNSSVFSDLQNLWDSYRSNTRMNLVLSGSVMSMMRKIFTDAHEPLFGRADNIIHLRPFKIKVLKEILKDFNPDYTNEDLLALYTITGGIPKYIELLCDNDHVTADSMIRFSVSYMSPFIDEGRNLLITEFGRDYGTYFSILLAIAQGRTSQAEITAALGGMAIGGHLERLENTYNIISKFRPVMSKPGSRNSVRFRISDNFMQFWFRFIERNRSMIELDNYDDLREVVMRDYPVYSGLTLEKYFRQKLTEDGGFREMGSWWEAKAGKEANEIDIVGIRTEGKSALVAEVKRNARNYDHKAFMAKIEHIRTKILAGYEIESHLYTIDDM